MWIKFTFVTRFQFPCYCSFSQPSLVERIKNNLQKNYSWLLHPPSANLGWCQSNLYSYHIYPNAVTQGSTMKKNRNPNDSCNFLFFPVVNKSRHLQSSHLGQPFNWDLMQYQVCMCASSRNQWLASKLLFAQQILLMESIHVLIIFAIRGGNLMASISPFVLLMKVKQKNSFHLLQSFPQFQMLNLMKRACSLATSQIQSQLSPLPSVLMIWTQWI